ncbi:BMC domain-containing protein [Clostridium septicum]|uniref:BMC domain-containing protein n=1 Tax=Clostridium septicum TaxID=1504 RepID=UPI003216AB69
MYALGLIETKGLLPAIEAADVMVKSADVSIVEKSYVGGALVTILIKGDVAAVKAAIEAGAAAVKKIDERYLISEHVISRPHEELDGIIGPNTPDNSQSEKEDNLEESEEELESFEEVSKETKDHIENIEEAKEILEEHQEVLDVDLDKQKGVNLEDLHKEDVDNLVNNDGIEKTILTLSKLKVVKLRNLAREYNDFVIKGRSISKADKNLLLTKFRLYYHNK